MSNQKKLRDWNVDTKFKIAALWVIYMFVFIYLDYYKLFIPGVIDEMNSGKLDGAQLNQLLLFIYSIITIIPALMIFLSLVLTAKVNRWLNLIVGILYLGIGIASLTGQTWPFWIFFSILLSLVAIIIVIYSWKWPLDIKSE